MAHYDLLVIGSGPSGEKAAVKAAYFGKKVAVVEKENRCGGAGVNTGTLPSKTLKETALYLSGKYDKGLYGIDRNLQGEATIENFLYRKNYIIETEAKEVAANLKRHQVDQIHGLASFESPHEVAIKISEREEELVTADFILIATGSYPFHPTSIPFDKKRIHDSDTILDITRFPRSIAILGAGVIGVEYATIFSTMGAQVHLINRSDQILTFIDKEVVNHFLNHLKKEKMALHFNQSIASIFAPTNENEAISIHLESGQILKVDMFLFAAGRNGKTKELNLSKIGIEVDKRENILVNERYQTNIPHIYAVGDVIGFPALASTGMDQGRVAVAHMFQTKDIEKIAQVLPYGIYTVPEISTAGLSEEEAKNKQIDYATGLARYPDMPRGKIIGATDGFLKLVFSKKDLVILGVHIIGHLATELIHHGMGLIDEKKTLLDVIGNVYNYPTLHELYKYAAYDGLGTTTGHKIKR